MEDLREGQARLKAMLEAFDGYIYVCSRDYRVEFMNAHLIERTGYDGTGQLCYKVLHERDEVCPWCVNDRVFAGETVRWEVQSPKDQAWFQIVNTPLRHPDGTVSKQAMIVDITHQKRLQEKLSESAQKYRTLLQHLPVGVMSTDRDLCITEFNAQAEFITGVAEGEAIGRPCYEVLSCHVRKGVCPLHEVMSKRKLPEPVERVILNRKTRQQVEVQIKAAGIYDRDGQLTGGVEVFQDISLLKSLERQRANIVSVLAHDLKSPLMGIQGFSHLLSKNLPGISQDKAEQYLEIISQNARKLEEFLKDFLDFYRRQSGHLELNFQAMDLKKELSSLAESLQPDFALANVELDLVSCEASPLVMADAPRLRRAFINLLENALKHSPSGCKVTLTIITSPEEVEVSVRDQGPGITPEDIPFIFEPFYRGKGGKGYKGHGLGLAGVKAMVTEHGGQVLVESTPGQGSLFRVVLPLDFQAPAIVPAESSNFR